MNDNFYFCRTDKAMEWNFNIETENKVLKVKLLYQFQQFAASLQNNFLPNAL